MNRTVVVSGGGIGIGRAIARSFAVSGDTVVIVGRRASVLRDTEAQVSTEAQTATSKRSPPTSQTPPPCVGCANRSLGATA